MKSRIIVAVIFVPVLFCAITLAPPVVTLAVVAIISAVAARELMTAAGLKHKALYIWLAPVLAVAVCVLTYVFADDANARLPSFNAYLGETVKLAAAFALFCAYALTIFNAHHEGSAVKHPPYVHLVTAGIMIPQLLSAIIALRLRENGHLLVTLPFAVAFVTDCGAYFTGMLLGRHKAFPNVSPKKTVEGCVGGFLFGAGTAVAFGCAVSALGFTPAYLPLALCGAVGAVATEAGDLAFSAVKRAFGIKDYGTLLPGHGGMLDRFDSMATASPVIWLIVTLFPVLE